MSGDTLISPKNEKTLSKIGRKPIPIPAGVTVSLDYTKLTVSGPQGTLNHDVHSEVKVNIYNASGYLVEDNLINDNLKHYEFNEIIWDASHSDAGLYLAEIKPNVGQSELVRLVVIK